MRPTVGQLKVQQDNDPKHSRNSTKEHCERLKCCGRIIRQNHMSANFSEIIILSFLLKMVYKLLNCGVYLVFHRTAESPEKAFLSHLYRL